MAGHSKWANIKRKKEATDAKRGKIFTKIGRELAVAVKEGGPDPDTNSKLRDVIAKAKASNMPNDNIMRSIKKAAGEGSGDNYESIIYEGYGPSGVAVIVEALTDNRNRTASEMRHYFDKFGGNLGTSGCVMFMFDRKGVFVIANDGSIDEDKLISDALEAGAEDVNIEDEYFEVLTSPSDFSAVNEALEKDGYKFEEAEVQYVPQTYTKLTDEKEVIQMNKLIDHLEDSDDVQAVWHNWEQD
ncbi:MAG: YebC/PmpR family DNA-binding transcriptional regulator [Eubacteriales bacterium]|jgi:YebC/PmpR family DNA-binding regulatory protein|nr:YebC/PmpR family DNA-binding transcriptional regulator [Eubacteriales bacterium]